MTEYYTPEQIAYFFYEKNYTVPKLDETVTKLFKKECAFIDKKYSKKEDMFLKETLKYYSYFTYKEEYEKQVLTGKDLKDHLKIYEKFINNFSPNFFLITRLELIFGKEYKIIKLRTLLKKYGYKSRHHTIMLKFRDNINFYHLDTYKKGEKLDLFDFNLDERITFRLK